MVIYKPFTTIRQQIELLKSRGVVFPDEIKAMEILEREGYYSVVNGLKIHFLSQKIRINMFKEQSLNTFIIFLNLIVNFAVLSLQLQLEQKHC